MDKKNTVKMLKLQRGNWCNKEGKQF